MLKVCRWLVHEQRSIYAPPGECDQSINYVKLLSALVIKTSGRGFHGARWSLFFSLLQFPSYDVINDVIMT